MRKLFSILSLVLLSVAIIYGQAAVNNPLTGSDGTATISMAVGLDLTATDCIDPALGEAELPPLPPDGVFDIRFKLPASCGSNNGVLLDYRNAPAFPYTGTVQHNLHIQRAVAGTAVDLTYDLVTGATMTVSDQFGGVIYTSGPLTGTGTLTITGAGANLSDFYVTMGYDNVGPVGPAPVFAIDPTSYAFGDVFTGSSANTTASISNTGTGDLTVQQPAAVGAFSVTGPFPITIAEGGAPVDVTITFAPTTAGAQQADLVFDHNAAGSPFLFHVTGTGVGPEPIFRVVPTSLNFGNKPPLSSNNLTVTVYNDGVLDPLIISSATIAAPEFVVNPTSANIPSGGSQIFTVTFTPPAVGNYTGTLVFDDNAGGPHNVGLSGNGYIPPAVYGLVFDSISVHRYENASYSNNLDLLSTDGDLHALQFRLLTNMETDDDILLTYQSIQKGAAISGSNWILETNVRRGTIHANGASEDTIYVLLYNINNTGDLAMGNYPGLFTVNYKVAKLPPTITEQKSTFRIFNAEGSSIEGNPIAVTPSRDLLTVYVDAAGGGYGDVNGDGCVDILDLIMVVDHIVGRDSLTGDFFTRADIAPWVSGDPAPTPDGVVNVQDLSVIQNIILTGQYPNGQPVGSCSYVAMPKISGDADAKVTLYINTEGISAFLDSKVDIRGAQIEFGNISNDLNNLVINTDLGQGFYMKVNNLLRTLMYDRLANKYIEAGQHFLADMPFRITSPNDITVEKIILVDMNRNKVQNIQVEIINGSAPPLPLDYVLFQNYPNPFNPTTTVKFQVPQTSNVTVTVYNMLGQEVRTLFTGQVQRGTYSVQWDGMNDSGVKMSSGTYIYRMKAGEFVQSKKMILLK